MSTFKGEKLNIEIFGRSHSEVIGVTCHGFPKIKIDKVELQNFLNRRKPKNTAYSTARKEEDQVQFVSGVDDFGNINGQFTAQIQNIDKKSADYSNLYGKPRPSHADYCAYLKDGRLDFSGGGEFSGRLTAPLCIAGGIALQYLNSLGIKIYAYLSQVGSVLGESYKDKIDYEKLEKLHKENTFPALSKQQEMIKEIENAKKDGDSVGAVCQCVVLNAKKGMGNAIFDGLEAKISQLIFAIPAVKGVEFGQGFNFASMKGSLSNDQLCFAKNQVQTLTNNCGGIYGGISNGMPITLSVAFKPTPSIYKVQKTVDLVNKVNTEILINGRHDSCIAVRAVPVVESAVALAILDLI